MQSRLTKVLSAVFAGAMCLGLAACGGAKPAAVGDVSRPDLIGYGPGVYGLTAKVKQHQMRICLAGIDASSSDYQTWEDNIQSVVLKWVDAIRPIAHTELTS